MTETQSALGRQIKYRVRMGTAQETFWAWDVDEALSMAQGYAEDYGVSEWVLYGPHEIEIGRSDG